MSRKRGMGSFSGQVGISGGLVGAPISCPAHGLPKVSKSSLPLRKVVIVVEARTRSDSVRDAATRLGLSLLVGVRVAPIPRRTRRSTFYAGALPDRITIYRSAICAVCNSDSEVAEQVRRTVIHEVGHHFGIGDARLRELGARAEGHGGVRWSFLLWTGLRRRRSSQSIS